MTRNQLTYWQNVETERSNRAQEQETVRSNLAKEAELRRSNLARENENYRSNRVNELLTQRRDVAEAQNKRISSLASQSQARTAYRRAIEDERAHKRDEILRNTDILMRNAQYYSGLAQTERIKANELAETYRSNKARETENIRSNVAKESENRRSNMARERQSYIDYLENKRSNVSKELLSQQSNWFNLITNLSRATAQLLNH